MRLNTIPGYNIVRTIAHISKGISSVYFKRGTQKALMGRGFLYGLPYNSLFAMPLIPAYEDAAMIPPMIRDEVLREVQTTYKIEAVRTEGKAYARTMCLIELLGEKNTLKALELFGGGIVEKDSIPHKEKLIGAMIRISEKNFAPYFGQNEINRLFQEEIMQGTSSGRALLGDKINTQNLQAGNIAHLVNNTLGGFIIVEEATAREDIEQNRVAMRQLKIIEDWLHYNQDVMRGLFREIP